MITIDCPLCLAEASVDEALTTVTCDDCGAMDVVDEASTALDIAA